MDSIFRLLHRAEQNAKIVFGARGLPSGMTQRQFDVLVAVENNPGASQTTLTEKTMIDRSTLSNIVFILDKKNLLKRARTEDDKRAYGIVLTEKGRSMLSVMHPIAEVANGALLGTIPDPVRDAFLDALERLAKIQLSDYTGQRQS